MLHSERLDRVLQAVHIRMEHVPDVSVYEQVADVARTGLCDDA
jgi:hypothetical protein